MLKEARESYSHKYDRPFTAWLHGVSLAGGNDAELGDVETIGHFSRLGRHVLVETSQGFVDSDRLSAATDEAFEAFVADCVGPDNLEAWLGEPES